MPVLQRLQAQVHQVVTQRAVVASCRQRLPPHAAASGSPAHPGAHDLIFDLITRSLVVGLAHQLQARLHVQQRSLRNLVPKLLHRHRERIYQVLADLGQPIPTWKRARWRPSYQDLQTFLTAVTRLSFPGKGLPSTLTPTLTYLDTGKRSSGGMDPNLVTDILQALGESGLLEAMFPTVADETVHQLLDQLTSATTADAAGRLPIGYPGRHHLPAWSELRTHAGFMTPQITLRFSEAERIRIVHLLQSMVPTSVDMGEGLYRALQQLGSTWPCRTALPSIDDDLFLRLVSVWRRLGSTDTGDHQPPSQPGAAGWPLALPPSGDLQAMASDLHQRAPSWITLAEAGRCVAAWYADTNEHGVRVTLRYDELHLVMEAVLGNLLRLHVPLPDVLVAASILSKTGLPWLPPAQPPIALHVPAVSISIVLGAVRLLEESSPSSPPAQSPRTGAGRTRRR